MGAARRTGRLVPVVLVLALACGAWGARVGAQGAPPAKTPGAPTGVEFTPAAAVEFFEFLGPAFEWLTLDAIARDGLRFFAQGASADYGGRAYARILIRARDGRERKGYVAERIVPPQVLSAAAKGAAATPAPSGVVGAVIAGLAAAPPPPPSAQAPSGVLRVGGNAKPPTRTKQVPPVYPSIAQTARVQGVVIIEAVVGPTGVVEDARVLRSIPLLDQAALDAVKQWQYTPTLIDGKPVPVLMTVTVQFTLADRTEPLTPPQREALLEVLRRNHSRWVGLRLSGYTLSIAAPAVPSPSVRTSRVRDGKAVEGLETVERLFAQLAAALETADDVAVTYDPDLAFPATFTIDPSLAVQGDEIRAQVRLTPDAAAPR